MDTVSRFQQRFAFPARAVHADNPSVEEFVGMAQLTVIRSGCRGEERQWFRDKLAEVAGVIAAMPKTYDQDGKGDAATVWLHYFTGGSDWWITERDREDVQHQAFGLADLFGDGGELGYISIPEILAAGAELDLHWTPKTLREVRAARRRAEVVG